MNGDLYLFNCFKPQRENFTGLFNNAVRNGVITWTRMFEEENGLRRKTLHFFWQLIVLDVNGQISLEIWEVFVQNI